MSCLYEEYLIEKKKFSKTTENYMDNSRRNFGLPVGQVTYRDSLAANLYMWIGTRVGTITAYYVHSRQNETSSSVVVAPQVNIIEPKQTTLQVLPEQETVSPLPEHTYDIPRKL